MDCDELVVPFEVPDVFVPVVPLVVPFVAVVVVPDEVALILPVEPPFACALDVLVVVVADKPEVAEPPCAVVDELVVPLAIIVPFVRVVDVVVPVVFDVERPFVAAAARLLVVEVASAVAKLDVAVSAS